MSQKLIKQFEAYKNKAKQKIDYFITVLDNSTNELTTDQKSMTECIKTLSKIRNAGAGKSNGGIILLDQYFKIPQIGEVIRDIWVLQSFAEAIQTTKERSPSNDKVKIIPEESLDIIEQMK